MAITYKQGWQAGPGGGNMVQNTATGQVLDIYHPGYTNAPDSPAPPPPSATPDGVAAPTGGAAQSSYPSQPTGGGQAVTGQATVGGGPTQGQAATPAGAFQSVLLNKLAPGQVDASNPNIHPAIQANQAAQQRASERLRMQNAERNAAQGLNQSGGAATEQIGVEQDRALQEGQFNANAILGESDKQRQQQSQMASIVAGLLGQQDTLGMQKYGIDTDAALRREGLAATTKLGEGDLDLRKLLGSGNLNLGLLGLLSGNENFRIGESGQNARYSSGLNQEAMLRMLGF